MRNPDAVGMHLLDEHIHRIESQGVHVLLVGVRADLADALVRTGIAGRLHPEHIFHEQPVRHTSTQMGVQYAYQLIGTPMVPDSSQALHYRFDAGPAHPPSHRVARQGRQPRISSARNDGFSGSDTPRSERIPVSSTTGEILGKCQSNCPVRAKRSSRNNPFRSWHREPEFRV